MRRAGLRWAVAVLAVLPAGCRRSPYAKLRPHEALQAADDLYRKGRLQEAEGVYELALAKAVKAELGEPRTREYYDRLVQVCARLDELEKAERYFTTAFESDEHPERWMGGAERSANNIAVLLFRRGDHAGAERLLTRALASLREGFIPRVDNPIQLVMQINLDRTVTAQGRVDEAAQVTREALTTLDDIAHFDEGRYWPLPPGMGASLTRYAAFLARQGREAQAASLGERVRDIEARAGGPSPPGSCVTSVLDAPMGCLLEIEDAGPG